MPKNHTVANMAKFAALGQSLVRTAVANQAALPTNNNSMPSTGSKLKLTTTAPANMMPKQIHLTIFILGYGDGNKCQHKHQYCSHNGQHNMYVFHHLFYRVCWFFIHFYFQGAGSGIAQGPSAGSVP